MSLLTSLFGVLLREYDHRVLQTSIRNLDDIWRSHNAFSTPEERRL